LAAPGFSSRVERRVSTLVLVVIWASLLTTFMVVHPSPYSFLFWLLLGSAMLFGGLYMFLSHRESRRTQVEALAWLRKVNELVDVHDYENDGHLEEYFDESERRRIVAELERMPVGSRSLRHAIDIVSPELAGR
jgi:hypothetical protein